MIAKQTTSDRRHTASRIMGLCAAAFLGSACIATSGSALPQTAVYAPPERITAQVEPSIQAPSTARIDAGTEVRTVPFDLPALLAYAKRHAPGAKVAQAQASMGDAAIAGAEVTLENNPVVSVGLGGKTEGSPSGFAFEIGVSQQFEIGGERALRIEAARDEALEGQAQADEMQWALNGQIRSLHTRIQGLREYRQQTELHVAFSRSLHTIAAARVDAGAASPLALVIAEAEWAQAQEALILVDAESGATVQRLATLIGWSGGDFPKVIGTLPDISTPPADDALIAQALAHHPAVRTAEVAVVARRARLRAEDADATLEPTLGVGYGLEPAIGPGTEAHVWMVNLAIPIPLWQQNQEGRAQARAALRLADTRRDQTVARLRGAVTQAAAHLRACEARVRLYSEGIVPKFTQNMKALERAFELGAVDIHQVSLTRQRLLDATAGALRARLAYFDAHAALLGLIGPHAMTGHDADQETP